MADAPSPAARRAHRGDRDGGRGRHDGGRTQARQLALGDIEQRSEEARTDGCHVDEGGPPSVVPRAFVGLTVLVVIAAAGSVAVLALGPGWHVGAPARFWLLALFILAGELLPIPVPRRQGLDKVAVSTAFAFAALLCVGVLPACAVYATASVS